MRALTFGFPLLLWASRAGAAPCASPDLLETIPADGATGVPTNAHLAARYAPSAEYLNEPIPFEHVGVGMEDATATFDANEGLLTLAPAVPLVPNDMYKITWPQLRGLTTAALGKGGSTAFTAGATADMDAPQFSGIRALSWDVERTTDDCTDSPQDRYRFDLALGDATDDGTPGLLTLVVFETVGPASPNGSPKPILVQRFPETGGTEVQTAIDDAVGRVCFAALVRDSLGRASSGTPEVCTTTVRPPFFYGCTIESRRDGAAGAAVGWLFVALIARARRRGAR